MRKKIALILCLLMMLSAFSFGSTLSRKTGVVALDFPAVGGVKHASRNGRITSAFGVNLGLGISYKGYFNPVRTNRFNPWWGIGTVALIVPYVGIGVDYVWDNGFYAGVNFPFIFQAGYLF